MVFKSTPYKCSACHQMRQVSIDENTHLKLIKKTPNGLVLYSDIHRCEDGILGINNLQIDEHFSIRSFSLLKFPTRVVPSGLVIPGLPMPKAKSSEEEITFYITQLSVREDLRIIIHDKRILTNVNIGRINLEYEKPISTLSSDLGLVIIDYYPSEIPYTSYLEKWFTKLVNILELLPPTKIGLFIETLRYIFSLYHSPPSSFNIRLLKTILTSHETYFIMEKPLEDIQNSFESIAHKYGENVVSTMNELLIFLEENPTMPLQYFTSIKSVHNKKDDLIYLIHVFLILEQEGLIIIDRPGIVDG